MWKGKSSRRNESTARIESMAAQSPVQEEEVTRPTRAHRSERGVLILLILLLGVLGLVIGMPRSWLPLSAPAPPVVTPQLVESASRPARRVDHGGGGASTARIAGDRRTR